MPSGGFPAAFCSHWGMAIDQIRTTDDCTAKLDMDESRSTFRDTFLFAFQMAAFQGVENKSQKSEGE